MTERWFSVDEVAVHLGIGRETVYRWIDRRDLPAHRIGKFWKFKISEVDAWVRKGAAAADGLDEDSGREPTTHPEEPHSGPEEI